MNNLNVGGAEKALVALLAEFDYSKYDVDLFLFSHEGLFLKQLPKNVRLLPGPDNYRYFDMPVRSAVVENIRKGNLSLAFSRIIAGYIFKTENNKARREQRVWKYLTKFIPNLPGEYDVAIGYLEKMPIYFCIEKVRAKIKIGFIHNDYAQLGMDAAIDKPYLNRLDHIFTVSESCEKILHVLFPEHKNKISVMYNIVSRTTIEKLAGARVDTGGAGITLVSVGRLNRQKGFDMAIDACRILVDRGFDIKWQVLGEGSERAQLEEQIKAKHLQNHFFLMGLVENPYPFVSNCGIYVQPSRFEGKSIAIDEAKILSKPIVVTNFATVHDQITHLVNGYIAEQDPESIASAIEFLVRNPDQREVLEHNLRQDQNNAVDLDEFYKVINK